MICRKKHPLKGKQHEEQNQSSVCRRTFTGLHKGQHRTWILVLISLVISGGYNCLEKRCLTILNTAFLRLTRSVPRFHHTRKDHFVRNEKVVLPSLPLHRKSRLDVCSRIPMQIQRFANDDKFAISAYRIVFASFLMQLKDNGFHCVEILQWAAYIL